MLHDGVVFFWFFQFPFRCVFIGMALNCYIKRYKKKQRIYMPYIYIYVLINLVINLIKETTLTCAWFICHKQHFYSFAMKTKREGLYEFLMAIKTVYLPDLFVINNIFIHLQWRSKEKECTNFRWQLKLKNWICHIFFK